MNKTAVGGTKNSHTPPEFHSPVVANPLTARDPGLLKHLKTFQSRLGNLLLGTLGPLLHDPRFRLGEYREYLQDIYASAQVLATLTKETWIEQDIERFDTHWKHAWRSALFADEFEADRHRLKAVVDAATKQLNEIQDSPAEAPHRQPVLW